MLKDPARDALPLVANFALQAAVGFVVGFVRGLVDGILKGAHVDTLPALGANLGLGLVTGILQMLVGAWLGAGAYLFALKVARGQPRAAQDVFAGGPFLVSMFGAQLLTALAVLGAMLLFIVPGIIVALGFSLAALVIVDQRLGAVAALGKSWSLTQGHRMNLFVLGLLLIVAAFVGLLACCVGLIAVYPLGVLALTYAYLHCVGERPVPSA